ncbi:transposase [Pyxidicoccus parkwayensis]|uniref:Transposase n=1 Tax=Pyxidicoccus parkwayensis TaxID=2813578 RepID=A0ABX7PCL8_9BACT|nr:transposase [Pyxidicoccus parkwaysis]
MSASSPTPSPRPQDPPSPPPVKPPEKKPTTPPKKAETDPTAPKNAPTGKEAAQRLQDKDRYIGAAGRNERTREFTETIQQHQSDPAYLKQLYAGLGDKDSKELISSASAQIAHDQKGLYKTDAKQTAALKALGKSMGSASPNVVNELAREAARSQIPDAMVSVLKQPETPESVRRTFLDESAKTANKNTLQAQNFADVLNSDPKLIQNYAASLNREKFLSILEKGLQQPPHNNGLSGRAPTRSDGAARILGQVPDLFKGPMYSDFRANIFRVGANTLGDKTDPARATQLDGLKKIFRSDPSGIINELTNNSGGPNSAYDRTGQALPKFLRDSVINGASKDPGFAKFVKEDLPKQLRSGALNPATASGKHPVNNHYARTLGNLTGAMVGAYGLEIKRTENAGQFKEDLAETIAGLALGPLGTAGEAGKVALKNLITDVLSSKDKSWTEQLREVSAAVKDKAKAGLQNFDNGKDANGRDISGGKSWNTETERQFEQGYDDIIDRLSLLGAN